MSEVLSRELPAPRRWQELESLAFDVYRRQWKTSDAQLNGRAGQPQAGVDVYGTDRLEGRFTGVQCKGKDGDYGGALTETELRQEVAKALTFEPPLDAYVVLTTAPNDAAIQRVAREISGVHAKQGLFEVRVTGWDTFRHYVAEDQDVLVKYFRDFAPVDVVARLAASSTEQAQGFARIESMMRTNHRMISGLRDGHSGGDTLAERVTEISRVIGDGAPTAAIRALERLLAEEGDTASPLARYRLLASLGNARYALGEEAAAIALFRQAHAAHPDYTNARVTLAIAHLLESDRPTAYELAKVAFAEDTTSARTAGVLIDAAPEGTTIEQLESLVGVDLLVDPDVKLHLSMRAHSVGDEAAQLRFAEEALAAAPEDWRALSAVAEGLMQPLATLDGLALTHDLPENRRADVERATELTARAWVALTKRESTSQGRHVAANLISLLGLAGRDGEADTVLDEALRDSPAYAPLVVRAAQRAADKGDWMDAASKLDAVDPAELPFDGLLLHTQATMRLGDPARSASLVERLAERGADEPVIPERGQLIDALRVRAAILGGANRRDAIEAVIATSPQSIVLRSLLFDDLPDDDPLRDRLTAEIRGLAGGQLSMRERIHAAETLYDAGFHSLAADLYAPLHGKTDSHALRRRLQALHLADRRAEARKLFESLPQAVRTSPGYLGLGINIYERAGLLKAALSLLEKALTTDDVLRNRLAWIQLLVRLGRQDEMADWLSKVPATIEGSAGDLMSLARVIDQYVGHDARSLEIGYRALRAGYNRPELHLGFAIGLVINGRPDESALAPPSAMEAGAGVALINEATGETLFRIIETEPGPIVERGELSPSDPFAQRLLGLKVGDAIEMAKAGVGTQAYRVVELQSRALFAFRRALRDFTSLFPENPAFGSFEIDETKGDDKFEEMFALARRRAEHGREIETMYLEGTLPLPMIAKFTGSSVFELWDALSRQPELGLKSAVGMAEEFANGRTAAHRGVVVIDPVSIYAWTRMGVADTMAKIGIRLAVVQSAIDALRQLMDERKSQRGKKMGTFGWDGERYNLVELTEEAIDAQVEAARNAVTFAETLLLVPAESDSPIAENVKDLLKDLEPAYHDTVIAALVPNRTLLTDDLGFRVIAQEAGAAFTWTQALAQAGHGSTGISHPAYRGVVAALIDANYRFTQFGPAEVLGELLESGWAVNDRLKTYARLMTSETLDRGSIGALLAQVLIDSKLHAPNDEALAAFHVSYAEAAAEAGKSEVASADYDSALAAVKAIVTRNANRLLLPKRLLETTHLNRPGALAAEFRGVAVRQVKRIAASLANGGLEFALSGGKTRSSG